MLQSQMGSWPEQEVNPKFRVIRTVVLKAQGGSWGVLVKHAISWLQLNLLNENPWEQGRLKELHV